MYNNKFICSMHIEIRKRKRKKMIMSSLSKVCSVVKKTASWMFLLSQSSRIVYIANCMRESSILRLIIDFICFNVCSCRVSWGRNKGEQKVNCLLPFCASYFNLFQHLVNLAKFFWRSAHGPLVLPHTVMSIHSLFANFAPLSN